MRRLIACGLVCVPVSLFASCADDTQQRLSGPLTQQGIKEVVVTEEKIIATCSSGEKVEVNADELERNFLGMAKGSKVTTIAKNILRDCEEKDSKKRQEEAIKARIADETKRLGIDTTGLDEKAVRAKICEKLTAALPIKDPERTVEGARNTNAWGCEAPPPPAALPTGGWAVEIGKPQGKKPGTSFLRLQNDGGEKLTIRCTAGKKADVYVQPASPVKKKTTVIDAKLDGGKAAKWKVKGSTDGKALFFVDTKGTFKAMNKAQEVAFVIPGPKKPSTVTFAIKGFSDAAKQLPKPCQ